MHSLLSHPPLLAHTIYQALDFDASLHEDGFSLSGTLSGRYVNDTEWKGISDVILGRKEWFDRWVEGEKACKHRFPVMRVQSSAHAHA
jgi:RAD50-interacting protein 1